MAEETAFDLVVIGGGPGGYTAAIRGAQLGMKVACVEKDATLGGTCLNVGCIPSKALLDSSEFYHLAVDGLGPHGIKIPKVELDLKTMLGRKDKVVGELTKGVEGLLKKNKVTRFQGTATLTGPNEVKVAGGKAVTLKAEKILIATGSEPIPLPFAPFDGKNIISSTEALSLSKVPKHLIIIGGGVIGMELGSVWRRLGAEVTVVEMLPQLLGNLDAGIHRQALRSYNKQGLTTHLNTRVTAVESKGETVTVKATTAKGEELTLKGDKVLVGIGRRPYAEKLGAKEVGVAFDETGRITVNAAYQTNVPSIYAVGDVIPGPMLAHKASEEGVAAIEQMNGIPGHVNYEAIPFIVYTWPEVAWVGKSEEDLKKEGTEYKSGTFPFMATGRAKAMGTTEGQVKILADARTDRLLGVFVFGPRASDVIAEAVIAFEFGASAEDLARSVHAHPTLSEAVKEAALGVAGRTLNL